MTHLTPQQMRDLADLGPLIHIESWGTVCAALRAAADQLEAVRKEAEIWADAPVGELVPCINVGNLFLAILTADTAPQEHADGGPITSGRIWADTAAQESHNGVPVFRDENGRAGFGCSLEPITPETAPQEDRDECGVVTEDPLPMFCTKPHGHEGAHNTDGVV